jgi:glutathione-regulated potassium-efflux system ancillary protein KefF
MTTSPILVLYAHPAPQRSPANRRLVEVARAMPGVQVQDLYELYPDFDIDGERERALLAAAHLVVFLHPFRWYGMPSLMKEWMEIVLQPGWAYGKGECALRGKGYWLVTTTGSGPEAYRPGGLHGRPFHDFLAPFEQTASLCDMDWIEPLVLHGASKADAATIEAHAAEFHRRLAGYGGVALAAATPFTGEE